MIISDFHTHCFFSSDSTATQESMVEEALRKNLKYYCFTDHMDLDFPEDIEAEGNFQFDVDSYKLNFNHLTEKYKDRDISLRMGIEMGVMPKEETIGKMNELLSSHGFDFVIASTHIVDGMDPYYENYWNSYETKKAIRRYFETTYDSLKMFTDYDVLGHIDYISRVIPGGIKDYSFKDFSDILLAIVDLLISNGKGLEINTSAYKSGVSYPHPKSEILKYYKEKGGELITFGSDAHKPEHIAYCFERAEKYVRELGFKYYAVFKSRKQEFLPF